MATSKEKDQVPLLTGINFAQWSLRMGCLLVDKDLDDVVGFDLVTFAPNQDAPTLEDADAVKRDRKAKAKIQLRLSDTVLVMAQTASTSHALWKILHNTYQRSTTAALVASFKTLVATT